MNIVVIVWQKKKKEKVTKTSPNSYIKEIYDFKLQYRTIECSLSNLT